MTDKSLSSKIFTLRRDNVLDGVSDIVMVKDVKEAIQKLQEDIDKLPDKIQFKESGTKIWVDYRKVIEIIQNIFGDALVHSPERANRVESPEDTPEVEHKSCKDSSGTHGSENLINENPLIDGSGKIGCANKEVKK